MFRTIRSCIALLSGPVQGAFRLHIKSGANVIKVTDCPKPFFALANIDDIELVNGEPFTNEMKRYINHDYKHRYAVIPDAMVEEIDLAILSQYGWICREKSPVEIWYKDYETAVGVQTASITRYNYSVRFHANYMSEGHNVVGGVFTAGRTFEESITEIDRLIDQSYGRRLLLEHGVDHAIV